MTQAYAVFCGIDVGKGEHHAVGLDPDGKRLFDKALPNDEARLRAVFDQRAARGRLLIVVDQPNTIGALPVTVARACGHDIAYLPGLSMRRIADLYPGQSKTDARDAHIIADAARTMPHTLRRVDTGDETLTELGVLVGFDDDLAGEATRTSDARQRATVPGGIEIMSVSPKSVNCHVCSRGLGCGRAVDLGLTWGSPSVPGVSVSSPKAVGRG